VSHLSVCGILKIFILIATLREHGSSPWVFWWGHVAHILSCLCVVRCDFRIKTMFDSSVSPFVYREGGSCLICVICVFAHSGVQHILCCVFVLFFFILCALCCQFLWIDHLWLSLRCFLTLIPPLSFTLIPPMHNIVLPDMQIRSLG